MANGTDKDWGWKDDFKSWLRWLIYDTIFGWLRERWEKLTLGELVAASVVAYAYVRNHPQLLLFGLGAVVALGVQLIDIGLRTIFHGSRKTPTRVQQDGPFQIEIVDSAGKHPIPVPIPKTAEEWTSWSLKPVVNQKYIRENVPLDGKNYVNCDFERVTFWYDGTAPTAMTDCTFDEESMKALHTHSPMMSQWMAIAKTFGALQPDVRLGITPLPGDRREVTPHEEIRFDYLPASPLENGWRIAYPDPAGPFASLAAKEAWTKAKWQVALGAPTLGGMSMTVSNKGCAIDIDISRSAALCNHISCDVQFSDSTMLFVRVLLTSQDKSQSKTKLIKFELGGGEPFPTKDWEDLEWTLPFSPTALGNGWRHIDLALSDAVNRTWGRLGWHFSELRMIRLRGDLSISPIKIY